MRASLGQDIPANRRLLRRGAFVSRHRARQRRPTLRGPDRRHHRRPGRRRDQRLAARRLWAGSWPAVIVAQGIVEARLRRVLARGVPLGLRADRARPAAGRRVGLLLPLVGDPRDVGGHRRAHLGQALPLLLGWTKAAGSKVTSWFDQAVSAGELTANSSMFETTPSQLPEHQLQRAAGRRGGDGDPASVGQRAQQARRLLQGHPRPARRRRLRGALPVVHEF